jgi:hypothetical protein
MSLQELSNRVQISFFSFLIYMMSESPLVMGVVHRVNHWRFKSSRLLSPVQWLGLAVSGLLVGFLLGMVSAWVATQMHWFS